MWDPKARKTYDSLMDPLKGLSLVHREQLAARIDALRRWPTTKWYDLRDRIDGTITFQLESDQFLEVLGLYEDEVVKITHLRLKVKRRP